MGNYITSGVSEGMSALGEGAGRPSERICPDADTNFKFTVDQICSRAYREVQKQNEKK